MNKFSWEGTCNQGTIAYFEGIDGSLWETTDQAWAAHINSLTHQQKLDFFHSGAILGGHKATRAQDLSFHVPPRSEDRITPGEREQWPQQLEHELGPADAQTELATKNPENMRSPRFSQTTTGGH